MVYKTIFKILYLGFKSCRDFLHFNYLRKLIFRILKLIMFVFQEIYLKFIWNLFENSYILQRVIYKYLLILNSVK